MLNHRLVRGVTRYLACWLGAAIRPPTTSGCGWRRLRGAGALPGEAGGVRLSGPARQHCPGAGPGPTPRLPARLLQPEPLPCPLCHHLWR